MFSGSDSHMVKTPMPRIRYVGSTLSSDSEWSFVPMQAVGHGSEHLSAWASIVHVGDEDWFLKVKLQLLQTFGEWLKRWRFYSLLVYKPLNLKKFKK